jgi:hypothetical protein
MKKIMVFSFVLVCHINATGADMNWQDMTITSAVNERTDAVEVLQEELYAVQYDDTITIGDFVESHPEFQPKFQECISAYTAIKQNYLTDGGIQYVYTLPLTNKIMSLLLPERHDIQLVVPMLCPCCGQEWPAGKPLPEGIELTPKRIETTDYSGIIIDCRGLTVSPCLFPTVYDDKGNEIYSASFATETHIINNGLIMYTTELFISPTKVGTIPLRIQAQSAEGMNNTHIVISSRDAQRIHGSLHNLKLLKECRVAVILGL